MTSIRIALANVRYPSSPDDSIDVVTEAIAAAAKKEAKIVCFPECIIPGYRVGSDAQIPESTWLEDAWREVDGQALKHGIAVVLGTDRIVNGKARISVRVTDSTGNCIGFQDKVQLDPSEESMYEAATERQIFQCGDLTFGVVICHEGWRYPETVRWAARNGAQVVFHPHFELVENPSFKPNGFGDPYNTFHEKAAMCRAAENTCYFATVNCALKGATTTSAVVDPDGDLMSYQPHGEVGILVEDIDLSKASGYLAERFKPEGYLAT